MSLDEHFIETSEEILAQLGFKDLKSFVKSQALLLLLAKIEKYQAEDRIFQKKFKMDFESFEGSVKREKNVEVFEQEDDYLDWRYAKESLDRLERQRRTLEHA